METKTEQEKLQDEYINQLKRNFPGENLKEVYLVLQHVNGWYGMEWYRFTYKHIMNYGLQDAKEIIDDTVQIAKKSGHAAGNDFYDECIKSGYKSAKEKFDKNN